MKMKKFINDPANLATEVLEGMALAYADKIKLEGNKTIVRAKPKPEDKVAIITLGGAGHEPALSGFVGEGMLDASVVGDVFAAPNAMAVLEIMRKFKRDAGILLVVLNHAGDIMSSNMAMKMAEKEGIKCKSILISDDISAGLDSDRMDRRGLAGCILLYKVVGAAAEEGRSLDEVAALGEQFEPCIATLAVAMTGCTHPQSGLPISELGDDEMEIGMGQHGEGGGNRGGILTADETAGRMYANLYKALSLKSGDKVFAVINGTGGSSPMELCVVYRALCKCAEKDGLNIVGGIIDELLTVQEMAGFQMILCKVDETTQKYIQAKSNAPYWTCNG